MLGSSVDAGELKMLGTEYSFLLSLFFFVFACLIFLSIWLREYPRLIPGEFLSSGEVGTAHKHGKQGLLSGCLSYLDVGTCSTPQHT